MIGRAVQGGATWHCNLLRDPAASGVTAVCTVVVNGDEGVELHNLAHKARITVEAAVVTSAMGAMAAEANSVRALGARVLRSQDSIQRMGGWCCIIVSLSLFPPPGLS